MISITPVNQDIKIGTLVKAAGAKDYIKHIAEYGFESFSIMFWEKTGIDDWKRYSDEIMEALTDTGAVISSLGMFGNALNDDEIAKNTIKGFEDCIDNAKRFGADLVTGFAGRVTDKPIDESMDQFKKIFTPLAERAKDQGVRIAFENCDMGGTWATGNWNIAHNPTAWEMMFNEVPADNIGLEWEPCHQMVSLIDPMPQLRKWVDKIFHVHGKDATVKWDVVREYGVHGPKQFAFHRTPGFGDSDWTAIISELRQAGFKGAIDIEGWHDPVYRGDLEMTGQVKALNYLKECRGGSYVKNPE